MFDINLGWTVVSFVIAITIGLVALKLRRVSPHLRFSNLKGFGDATSWRVRLAPLPTVLMACALLFFLIALADPAIVRQQQRPPKEQGDSAPKEQEEMTQVPTEGIALYLVLDRSGSMRHPVQGKLTRMDSMKQLTAQFVANRSSDLMGVVAFARIAEVLTPLTLDHHSVQEKLANLSVVRYREEDGTAIGYALFKTVNMIAATKHFANELEGEKPAYDIKSTAVVLVTDGLQSPNPLDESHPLRNISVEEAGAYAKEHDVHLYIVNIEPMVRSPQLAPQRQALEEAAAQSGGKFYIADNAKALAAIYNEIDRLERSAIPSERDVKAKIKAKKLHRERPDLFERSSLASLFIGMGLFCLFVAVALDATWLRRAL